MKRILPILMGMILSFQSAKLNAESGIDALLYQNSNQKEIKQSVSPLIGGGVVGLALFLVGQEMVRNGHSLKSEASRIRTNADATYWYPYGDGGRENSPGPIYRSRLDRARNLGDKSDKYSGWGKSATVLGLSLIGVSLFSLSVEMADGIRLQKRIRFGGNHSANGWQKD